MLFDLRLKGLKGNAKTLLGGTAERLLLNKPSVRHFGPNKTTSLQKDLLACEERHRRSSPATP